MLAESMDPVVRSLMRAVNNSVPTNTQICNWFRERPGAYVAPHPGIREVLIDGEVIRGVTACSVAEGWLLHVDSPPHICGDYIKEHIRFGRVELIMGGTSGAS